MTIQEMHKLFDLKLEAIASEVLLDINPAEKDLYLNDSIIKLVKSKFSAFLDNRTGAEESIIGNLELSTLSVQSKLPVYNVPSVPSMFGTISKVGLADLPTNCLFPLVFTAEYEEVTEATPFYTVTKTLYNTSIAFSNVAITKYNLGIEDSLIDLGFTANTTLDGFVYNQATNAITPSTFTISSVSADSLVFSSNFGINGKIFINNPLEKVSGNTRQATRNELLGVAGIQTPIKLYKQEEIASILRDPFNAPTKNSPIVILQSGKLYVYYSTSVALRSVILTYIKVPSKVNNVGLTKIDCDLPLFLHDTVVDNAVKSAYIDKENNPKPIKVQSLNENV